MRRRLPNLTKICAHGAKPLGAFGLVAPVFTNAYQPCDLAWNLPLATITNHRPPPEGITHSDDDYVLGRHTADTTHRMKTLCKLMNYV